MLFKPTFFKNVPFGVAKLPINRLKGRFGIGYSWPAISVESDFRDFPNSEIRMAHIVTKELL